MKVTEGKYYYDIIPYPHIETDDTGYIKVTCNKYPKCDGCQYKFKCYTQANEIIVVREGK